MDYSRAKYVYGGGNRLGISNLGISGKRAIKNDSPEKDTALLNIGPIIRSGKSHHGNNVNKTKIASHHERLSRIMNYNSRPQL